MQEFMRKERLTSKQKKRAPQLNDSISELQEKADRILERRFVSLTQHYHVLLLIQSAATSVVISEVMQ